MLRGAMHLAFFELSPFGVWVMATYSRLTFIPRCVADLELSVLPYLIALAQSAGMGAGQILFGFSDSKAIRLAIDLLCSSAEFFGDDFGWGVGVVFFGWPL